MFFLPRDHVPVAEVRLADADDLSFLDHLQGKFSHQLGYLPLAALEKRAIARDVWVGFENGQPAGYILGVSPYKGRDDVAIIYQSAIEYDAQRKSIATQLVEAWVTHKQLEHPNLKQIVCWCAQDIEANRFWEALEFLPLAWRAGSQTKQRIHIYWNRPLDAALQELWVPEATKNGLLRGPRNVSLFEPGQDWNDRIRVDWRGIEATMQEVRAAAEVKRVAKAAAAAEKLAAVQSEEVAARKAMAAAFGKPPEGFTTMVVGGKVRLIKRPH